jgi:pyruvate-formate lyase-activating enzyme
MILGGLQKITLIDFPGKIAATVFFSGCNFFCPWCYSPELVLPEKIKKQPKISEKEFFEMVRAGFKSKRKKLSSNLSTIFSKNRVLEAFKKLDINENTRAEDVSIETWQKITRFL